MEKLRQGVDKVYDLRDEEQQHGFAEMAEDPDHGEGHAGKVTERVAYKDRRRVPKGKQEPNNEEQQELFNRSIRKPNVCS